MWSTQSGQSLGEFYEGHSNVIQDIFITSNNQCLYSVGRDCLVVKWNADNYMKSLSFERQHSDWIAAVVMNSKEDFLYTGGGDAVICKWDQDTGKSVGKMESKY